VFHASSLSHRVFVDRAHSLTRRKFAVEGYKVAMLARTAERLEDIEADLT